MGIHRNTKPYFLPSAKCAGCPKENVPVSLCGRRYYCEDCFQYDSSEYGSQAALGSNKTLDAEGMGRTLKGRYHTSGTRGF